MKKIKSIAHYAPLFVATALLVILTGCVNYRMPQPQANTPVQRIARGRNGMVRFTIITTGYSTLRMLHKGLQLSEQGMLSSQDDAVRYITSLVRSGHAMIFPAETEVWWMDSCQYRGHWCTKVRKPGDLNEYWVLFDALMETVYPNAPKGDNASPQQSTPQIKDGQKTSVQQTGTNI